MGGGGGAVKVEITFSLCVYFVTISCPTLFWSIHSTTNPFESCLMEIITNPFGKKGEGEDICVF